MWHKKNWWINRIKKRGSEREREIVIEMEIENKHGHKEEIESRKRCLFSQKLSGWASCSVENWTKIGNRQCFLFESSKNDAIDFYRSGISWWRFIKTNNNKNKNDVNLCGRLECCAPFFFMLQYLRFWKKVQANFCCWRFFVVVIVFVVGLDAICMHIRAIFVLVTVSTISHCNNTNPEIAKKMRSK